MKTIFYLLVIVLSANSQGALPEKFEEIRNRHQVSGLAGALIVKGELIHISVAGKRKLGSAEDLRVSDKFHLGSCTKAMTATLAATFVEEGKLSWTSTAAELFPELELSAEWRLITFEELLSHRSGIQTDPERKLYNDLRTLPTLEAREKATQTFLTSSPREKRGMFHYSNLGYIIAGHVLERLSGRNWEQLLVERIFSPLGMKGCGFGPTSDPQSSEVLQPWGHYLSQGTLVPLHHDNAPFYGPAATVHCPLADWGKFLQLHVEQKALLSKDSFRKLHQPAGAEGYTPGGWVRLEREWGGGEVLMHSGSNVVNQATVWIAPSKAAIFMSTSNTGEIRGQAATNEVIVELIKLLEK